MDRLFTGDYRDPTRQYFLSGNIQLEGTVLSKSNYVSQRFFLNFLPLNFVNGKIYNQDINTIWPQEINMLDAIITSPPFFDSTRFYQANWLRIWFSGWSEKDFKHQISSFIEEKQKKRVMLSLKIQ